MGRGYPRLEIEPFGAHLLATADLDPVYVALNRCSYETGQRLRWLAAYIAFYHCGAACWMSERTGQAFWDAMAVGAEDRTPSPVGGKWPRGHERRYFYRSAASTAIAQWRERFPQPEHLFEFLRGPGNEPFQRVAERARSLASVGPWLSFKIVDLVDACLGAQIDQSDIEPFLYETPRRALLDVWVARHQTEPSDADAVVRQIFYELLNTFNHFEIPHKPGTRVGNFEIETIACKHGSHMSGHYELFADTMDIHHGLRRWEAHARSVGSFIAAMPPDHRKEEPVWKQKRIDEICEHQSLDLVTALRTQDDSSV